MGKILYYKSEGRNRIVADSESDMTGIDIGQVLSGRKSEDYICFLNNRRIRNKDDVIRDNDLLFVFLKKDN